MIFESLWPLAFLLAVPVVIILYLLVPKGKDYKISSNLLWEKLFKNQQRECYFCTGYQREHAAQKFRRGNQTGGSGE